MGFLSFEEEEKIIGLLSLRSKLGKGDANLRASIVQLAGLEKELGGTIYYSDSASDFAIKLWAGLMDKDSDSDGQKVLCQVKLLIYLQAYDTGLNDTDKELIKYVIEKGKKWITSEEYERNKKRGEIWKGARERAGPDCEPASHPFKNSDLLPASATTTISNLSVLDKDVIIKYDLTPLVRTFEDGLRRKKGVYGFWLAGTDETVIEEYILERLKRALVEQLIRQPHQLSLYLYLANLEGQAEENFIEKQLENQKRMSLTELLEAQSSYCPDIFFVLWTYSFPHEVLQRIMEPFWQKIKNQLEPEFSKKNRCLICVCVNIGFQNGSLADFTGLAIDESEWFGSEEMLEWFEARLQDLKPPLSPDKKEEYLRRLRIHRSLAKAYLEMNRITRLIIEERSLAYVRS